MKSHSYRWVIIGIFIIIVMGLASALDDIGTYRANTNMNLNLGCSYNRTYCPSTFNCNVTIFNKDGILINNKAMGTTLYPQYNYTIQANNLSTTGLYYGRQVCCGAIGCADYSFQFDINAQGKEYGAVQGSVYVILLTILILVFTASLYGSIKIRGRNVRTDDGKLFRVNWQKYLKFFLFMMAYVCFIGIAYFAWNISYGILEFTEMAGFFYFLFRTAYILMFPLGLVIVIYALACYVTDRKYEKLLERGLTNLK